jgi:hypothetical protein
MSDAISRGPGEELIRRLVGQMQRVFYPETVGVDGVKARPFYEELRLLRQAATYGAQFLRNNGSGEFDTGRYEEIYREVLKKVALHGPPASEMRCRGRYLLKAVQDHWRHHWEEYQPECKAAGARVEAEMRALAARQAVQPAPELRVMTVLAAVADALATGRPRKAAGKPDGTGRGEGKARLGSAKGGEIQEELF